MEDNWDFVLESIKFNAEKAKYNCRLCKYAVEYCRGKINNKYPCEFHNGKTASKEIVRLFLKINNLHIITYTVNNQASKKEAAEILF